MMLRMSSDKLKHLREHIDQTDKEIVQALAERMMLVEQIGMHKKEMGLEIRDEKRREEVLRSRIELGKKCGLSEELVRKLFEEILDHSEEIEKK